MTTRYNRSPNPACAANLTGWQGFTSSSASPNLTRVINLPAAWLRPTGYRATNGNSGGNIVIFSAPLQSGTTGGITGQVWSGVIQAAIGGPAPVPITVYLSWLRTDNTQLSATASAAVTPELNVPILGVVTGTAPANAAGVCVTVGANAGATVPLTATAARIEQLTDPGLMPADGDTAGWSWTGTAGNSASQSLYDSSPWWTLAGV